MDIFFVLVLVRVVLTWIRDINWLGGPVATVSTVTDPYLNFFKGLIPPIGSLDVTPLAALLILYFLAMLIHRLFAV